MQLSFPHTSARSIRVRLGWRRAGLCLIVVCLALTLLFSAGSGNPVHARNAPGRRDRRPDREVRIRYPQRPSTTEQGNRPSLQHAPTTPAAAPPSSAQAAPATGD